MSTESRKGISARGPISWASLAVFILTGGGIVAYVRYEKEQKQIGNISNIMKKCFISKIKAKKSFSSSYLKK